MGIYIGLAKKFVCFSQHLMEKPEQIFWPTQYLLENGLNLFLCMGTSIQQGVIQSLFGVSSFSQITSGWSVLPVLDNLLSKKV